MNWTVTASTALGGSWLTATPSSGTAPSTITVSIDKTQLPGGGATNGTFLGQLLTEHTQAQLTSLCDLYPEAIARARQKISRSNFAVFQDIDKLLASPVDAVMIGNSLYVIEYGGRDGNIWKITLPADEKPAKARPNSPFGTGGNKS